MIVRVQRERMRASSANRTSFCIVTTEDVFKLVDILEPCIPAMLGIWEWSHITGPLCVTAEQRPEDVCSPLHRWLAHNNMSNAVTADLLDCPCVGDHERRYGGAEGLSDGEIQ